MLMEFFFKLLTCQKLSSYREFYIFLWSVTTIDHACSPIFYKLYKYALIFSTFPSMHNCLRLPENRVSPLLNLLCWRKERPIWRSWRLQTICVCHGTSIGSRSFLNNSRWNMLNWGGINPKMIYLGINPLQTTWSLLQPNGALGVGVRTGCILGNSLFGVYTLFSHVDQHRRSWLKSALRWAFDWDLQILIAGV